MSDTLIKVIVALALMALAVGAYSAFVDHEQQIGYDRAVADMNAEKLEAIDAANKQSAIWKGRYEAARQESERLVAQVLAAADRNRAAVADIGRLRYDLQSATVRLASAPVETCPARADALGELFGECVDRIERLAGRYETLARKADGHAIDAATLSQSWPE